MSNRSRLNISSVFILAALFCAAVASAGAAWQSSSPEPFRFVAFGDSGTGTPNQVLLATGMVNWHESHPFDTVLMLGDNIYPDGSSALFAEKFERPYAELLKLGVVFMRHSAITTSAVVARPSSSIRSSI